MTRPSVSVGLSNPRGSLVRRPEVWRTNLQAPIQKQTFEKVRLSTLLPIGASPHLVL